MNKIRTRKTKLGPDKFSMLSNLLCKNSHYILFFIILNFFVHFDLSISFFAYIKDLLVSTDSRQAQRGMDGGAIRHPPLILKDPEVSLHHPQSLLTNPSSHSFLLYSLLLKTWFNPLLSLTLTAQKVFVLKNIYYSSVR